MSYYPDTRGWYLTTSSLEDFVKGMLSIGYPIDMSLVGVFDDEGRGSRRDIELPLHKDGKYSASLQEAQGGTIVEEYNIDVVGLYCVDEGEGDQCITIVGDHSIRLCKGQAVVFDNENLLHGRKGKAGKGRLLVRMWVRRH